MYATKNERDWNQFHNPIDLAIGISTEANELLDIFRITTAIVYPVRELFVSRPS